MSAPNPGRQSPDPERQTGAQQQDVPGTTGQISDEESSGENQKQSEDTKHTGLESNPKAPMDAKADIVTAKDGRGDV